MLQAKTEHCICCLLLSFPKTHFLLGGGWDRRGLSKCRLQQWTPEQTIC